MRFWWLTYTHWSLCRQAENFLPSSWVKGYYRYFWLTQRGVSLFFFNFRSNFRRRFTNLPSKMEPEVKIRAIDRRSIKRKKFLKNSSDFSLGTGDFCSKFKIRRKGWSPPSNFFKNFFNFFNYFIESSPNFSVQVFIRKFLDVTHASSLSSICMIRKFERRDLEKAMRKNINSLSFFIIAFN